MDAGEAADAGRRKYVPERRLQRGTDTAPEQTKTRNRHRADNDNSQIFLKIGVDR